MDKEAIHRRAIAIKQLLDNEEIIAAWDEIEAELVEDWKRCDEPAKREEYWHMINGLENLKLWMHAAASHDPTRK